MYLFVDKLSPKTSLSSLVRMLRQEERGGVLPGVVYVFKNDERL